MKYFKFTEAERNAITNEATAIMQEEEHFLIPDFIDRIETLIQSRADEDGWVKVEDGMPEPLDTVWISNGKGWTTLGCRSDYHQGDGEELIWCWCVTNGSIYEAGGEIISECEEDDLDVRFWKPLPQPPK